MKKKVAFLYCFFVCFFLLVSMGLCGNRKAATLTGLTGDRRLDYCFFFSITVSIVERGERLIVNVQRRRCSFVVVFFSLFAAADCTQLGIDLFMKGTLRTNYLLIDSHRSVERYSKSKVGSTRSIEFCVRFVFFFDRVVPGLRKV